MSNEFRTSDAPPPPPVSAYPAPAAARVGGYTPSMAPAPAAPSRGIRPIVWIVLGAGLFILLAIAAVAVGGLLTLGTVVRSVGSGPAPAITQLQTVSQSVPMGATQTTQLDAHLSAGVLRISGGASDLLQADFVYNVAEWKPEVTYNTSGAQGTIAISQPGTSNLIRTPDGSRNEWTLRLNDTAPLKLNINVGAGQSEIKLGGLNVSRLDLHTGAGETVVDLSGAWAHNLDANIDGGLGATTLRLPRDTGVRMIAQGGLGSVHQGSLRRDGDTYTSATYGKTPASLNLTVHVGVGEITVEEAR
jgi:hypothetical protein